MNDRQTPTEIPLWPLLAFVADIPPRLATLANAPASNDNITHVSDRSYSVLGMGL